MTHSRSPDPPDFDELVGRDLDASERDRLQRVHELLVAAGPPPGLSSHLDAPPRAATVHVLRKRRLRLVAIAAAFGVIVFATGFLAGDRADYGTFDVVVMSGTNEAQGASARIEIFDRDAAGNWPMEIDVSGLSPSVSGRRYELWLTREGQPAELCGSFLADLDGTTVVPMNAPWRFDEFDGWVVVEQGSQTPLLTT